MKIVRVNAKLDSGLVNRKATVEEVDNLNSVVGYLFERALKNKAVVDAIAEAMVEEVESYGDTLGYEFCEAFEASIAKRNDPSKFMVNAYFKFEV